MIDFTSEKTSFCLPNQSIIIDWLEDLVALENKEIADLSFTFCSDDFLLTINQEHLDHDTYTDIITFDYCVGNLISGDIFISIDRVEDNAKQFGVSFENELSRVLAHGVLHLCGYKDKEEEDITIMRSKEDFYINLLLK